LFLVGFTVDWIDVVTDAGITARIGLVKIWMFSEKLRKRLNVADAIWRNIDHYAVGRIEMRRPYRHHIKCPLVDFGLRLNGGWWTRIVINTVGISIALVFGNIRFLKCKGIHYSPLGAQERRGVIRQIATLVDKRLQTEGLPAV